MRLTSPLIVTIFGVVFISTRQFSDAALPLGHIRNPAMSCWEIVSNDETKTPPKSGFYWLHKGGKGLYRFQYYSAGQFQAYCDMDTEGGGWTLVAKITDDYSWICPDKKGKPCQGSTAPPSHGNFWHEVHNRLFIKPEFVPSGADSGAHLPRDDVRRIFDSGVHSIRFSFYAGHNLTGIAANDAVASFFKPQKLFHDDAKVSLVKGQHYEFRVLRHTNPSSTTFRGTRLCWLPSDAMRYGYEGGLFMGTGENCHLDSNREEVQLKSHYVYSNGQSWYAGAHAFLKAGAPQVPHEAIMLWIR